MKRKAAIIISALLTISAYAQSLQSSFFSDNNMYSYRVNPAMASEKNFVGFGINNLNTAVSTNFGVNSFLFTTPGGQVVTGFNEAIPASQFLGRLKKLSTLSADVDESILAFGFWTKNGFFHNVEINTHVSSGVTLPKQLFEFAKVNSQFVPYDISAMGVNARAYAELAYGISKNAGDKFRFGGRAKLLVGLANADVAFDRASLSVNMDQVHYDVKGQLKLAAPYLKFGTKPGTYNEDVNVIDFKSVMLDMTRLRPSGFGGAVDFGFTYEPVNGLTLSASIQDLGVMRWTYETIGTVVGSQKYEGFEYDIDSIANGESNAVKDELDAFLLEVQKLLEVQTEEGKSVTSMQMMPFLVNAGLRYRMPFYNRWAVGMTGAYRHNKAKGMAPWWDARAGMSITPLDWLSLSGNYGISSSGLSWGAMLSLNVASINIFSSVEGYSGRVGRYGPIFQGLELPFIKLPEIMIAFPLGSFRYSYTLGFTITFGERHNPFPKKVKKSKE